VGWKIGVGRGCLSSRKCASWVAAVRDFGQMEREMQSQKGRRHVTLAVTLPLHSALRHWSSAVANQLQRYRHARL
jgi:hypothetical protein